MVRVAIADDSAEDLALVNRYIERYCTENGIRLSCASFSDGEDLLEQEERNPFDLLLLDVEMQWLNGIDVARTIRERNSETVILFISAIVRYAVQGYSVGAMDYLLKPVAYPDFSIKLRNALHYIEAHRAFRIQLTMDGNYRWLSSDQLRYVEVFRHALVYHTTDGDFQTLGTIGAIAGQLLPHHFVQCSRFSLVNLKYVTGIEDNTLLLGSDRIAVSRRRRKELVDALLRYQGGLR